MMQRRREWSRIRRGWLVALVLGLMAPGAGAQSVQPATDGTGTQVQRQGNTYTITGGSRSGDRANLFHSFEQFGLTAEEIAAFRTTADVRNILGRVVGGDPSTIDGLIRVVGGEANLFLMNPAGIVFGETARLDVSGSFLATTATGIGFESGWFQAVGTPNYAALVGDPARFAFALGQPGAIANFGVLRVPNGDLTLLGGTVINGGTLLAPNGDLVVAAVPGLRQVRLSQRGSLLSLDFDPLGLPQLAIAPSSLPALLTGGSITSASGIEVGANGTVRLVGGRVIGPGDVAIAPSVLRGHNTLLAASDTLSVQESQIRATGSLSLLAGDTVWLRDGDQPLRAIAQQDFQIQGNRAVDIFALRQPGSGFQAGGNLRLRSSSPVSADAHFYSGGNFRIEQLNGQLGTLFSPYDPVIRSLGDVSFNAYTGASLHIIAAGSVTIPGTIFINGADAASGLIETVTLSDGTRLSINGTTRPTLDIRAGVDPAAVGTPGILGTPPGGVSQTAPTSANITLGSVVADSPNLLVYLSTQYRPNTNLPGGSIQILGSRGITTDAFTGEAGDIVIDSRTSVFSAEALDAATLDRASGNIRVLAQHDINIGGALAFGNTAGRIQLLSRTGDLIVRGNINAGALAGNGGAIALQAEAGSIQVSGDLDTSSTRQGGAISIASGAGGTLQLGNLDAEGLVQGGAIALSGGSITTGDIATTSARGSGGDVSLIADNTITTGQIRTRSGLADGGSVLIDPAGDVQVQRIDARGGSTGQGGAVTVFTQSLLRIFGTNENGSSIDTSGGAGGGAIALLHGGFAQNQPFVVGDASLNGTAGSLTTGNNTLSPTQPYRSSFVQGNISIITNDDSFFYENDPDPANLPESTDPNGSDREVVLQLDDSASFQDNSFSSLEQDFIEDFEAYLNITLGTARTLDNAQATLAEVARATGIQPALVYIRFAPTSPDAGHSAQDELEIVLITAEGNPIRRRIVGATRARVLQTANRFRSEITDPRRTRSTRYLPYAQQLYRWLVTPLEANLQAEGIENIAFVLDEGLRSLPIAALHDGDQFLVERYSIGLMPSLSLVDTRYRPIQNNQVLAMGASEFTNLTPLPAVPLELQAITRDLWPGSSFLNETFTPVNLVAQRRQTPYGIVHLATHGEFLPGDRSNSYIQFWDEQIQLDEMSQLNFSDPPVSLLVLSACRTALGDAEAELGFAGLAVQSGAQTALASLWYVSDTGSLALMTEFYRQLQTAPIKAEALRQTQLALLRGDVQLTSQALEVRGENALTLPDDFLKGDPPNLNHPFYWSAFTLVGSPW